MSTQCVPRALIVPILAVALVAPLAQAQITWYVDDDAPGDPVSGDPTFSDPLEDGSAAHPFDAIQEGIDAASDGDTVLVLDGTYSGSDNKNLDFGGREIAVRSATGSGGCIIDCQGEGRGFHLHGGEGADSVVDGFAVTNGHASSGGAIFCENGSPTIVSCVLSSNQTTGGGGAIMCSYSDALILSCRITGNQGGHEGGGIAIRYGDPRIEDCVIIGNSLTVTAGRGGGVFCREGHPTMVDCVISMNSAPGSGGGVLYEFSSGSISACQIVRNSAGHRGGGIALERQAPILANCTIEQNTAQDGGGVACWQTNATIVSCVIAANRASYIYAGGGGIQCENGGVPTVVNCTITRNWAIGAYAHGGGIHCVETNTRIVNCIVWDNMGPGGQITRELGVPDVDYCVVEGGYPGTGNIDADPLLIDPDGSGTDPSCFRPGDYRLAAGSPCVDAGDNTAVPADSLDSDHDGDTGEPIPYDLDGNPRFADDPATPDTGNGTPPIVDIGAYEMLGDTQFDGVDPVPPDPGREDPPENPDAEGDAPPDENPPSPEPADTQGPPQAGAVGESEPPAAQSQSTGEDEGDDGRVVSAAPFAGCGPLSPALMLAMLAGLRLLRRG